MKAVVKFKNLEPYNGELRVIKGIDEVHYCYKSERLRTAFEGPDTGFTVDNKYIEQFEVFADDEEIGHIEKL